MELVRPFQLSLHLLVVRVIKAVSMLKITLPNSGRSTEVFLAALIKLKPPYAQERVMITNALKYRIDSSQLHSSQDHRAYNSFVQKVPTEMRNGEKSYLEKATCPTSYSRKIRRFLQHITTPAHSHQAQ